MKCITAFTASCLFAAATCGIAEAQSQHMTKQQARDLLQQQGIELLSENLPQQIIGGNVEALDAMITLGVDVNAKTGLPQSPLELAATSCSNPEVKPAATAHIVDSLVAAGANPNAPGIQGLGPLMIAAQQCGSLVIKHLIAAGAKLDSRTPQGFTPLSMALITKHYDAAEALIDAGARISPQAGDKLTQGSEDARLKDLVRRGTGGV